MRPLLFGLSWIREKEQRTVRELFATFLLSGERRRGTYSTIIWNNSGVALPIAEVRLASRQQRAVDNLQKKTLRVKFWRVLNIFRNRFSSIPLYTFLFFACLMHTVCIITDLDMVTTPYIGVFWVVDSPNSSTSDATCPSRPTQALPCEM